MTSTPSIFDPQLYRRVRQPLLAAETLPAWCYTAPEFYDREVERIFRKEWNFLGRADEIAKSGDYKVFDLVGESVIVLRDREDRLRAFANTCRHRGTRLLDGTGNCKSIACPYHAWVYALDGSLISSLGMDETSEFDPTAFGLIPLRLEEWAGFLFVKFTAEGGSLADYLGDLPQRFASYNFADMVCLRRKEYDLACNWKLYIENAMEDYHTPTVHRKSIGLQKTLLEEGGSGAWDAIYMPAPRSIAVLPEDIEGAFPPIAGLSGKPEGGTFFTVIYPSTFFATTQDCMWWLQEFPLGPGRTKVSVGSCFPRATVGRTDFEEKVQNYYKRWDKSLPEDNAISERQQAGLATSFAPPGRLSVHEPAVHRIANWVLDRVLDGEAPR